MNKVIFHIRPNIMFFIAAALFYGLSLMDVYIMAAIFQIFSSVLAFVGLVAVIEGIIHHNDIYYGQDD